jgi:hypothetical protein
VSRGLAGLLKSRLSRYRLYLPVVELALRVNVQPASCVGTATAIAGNTDAQDRAFLPAL